MASHVITLYLQVYLEDHATDDATILKNQMAITHWKDSNLQNYE